MQVAIFVNQPLSSAARRLWKDDGIVDASSHQYQAESAVLRHIDGLLPGLKQDVLAHHPAIEAKQTLAATLKHARVHFDLYITAVQKHATAYSILDINAFDIEAAPGAFAELQASELMLALSMFRVRRAMSCADRELQIALRFGAAHLRANKMGAAVVQHLMHGEHRNITELTFSTDHKAPRCRLLKSSSSACSVSGCSKAAPACAICTYSCTGTT